MDEIEVTQLAEERPSAGEDAQLKAVLEAIVYVTDEPLSAQQMAAALGHPIDQIKRLLDELVAEYARPEHGLTMREVAGGYKMATKAEHHEAVRAFVKKADAAAEIVARRSRNAGGDRLQATGHRA
jgi:segregation and condensation protein B